MQKVKIILSSSLYLFFAFSFPVNASEKAIPLNITTKTGQLQLQVEVADTDKLREKGLMFRDSLPDNGGMLFVYEAPQPAAMWMKNTRIPLDILFIDEEKRIINIHEEAIPYSEVPLFSRRSARYALELNGGAVEKNGIKAGDKVQFDLPSNHD